MKKGQNEVFDMWLLIMMLESLEPFTHAEFNQGALRDAFVSLFLSQVK